MEQECMVRERRERIATVCLQGILASPHVVVVNPTNTELSQSALIGNMVNLALLFTDDLINKLDGKDA